ncbi:MAG: ATP-binding protein [candidate division KSB1 bacterium]|nr:ATP-binding protein [candidate division KSB1 bacterium]MDZ7342686.1 ATP-binding protein [candidate division KSB1 bacterium]
MTLEDYLYEQNVHWLGNKHEAGTERDLLQPLLPFVNVDHVLAISGVRRCGKSFLMKQLINSLIQHGAPAQNILFANLELPGFFGRPAAEMLDELWNTYHTIKNPDGRIYLFLDEIQTLPGWEQWVKYHYDLHKGKLKIFITGSNSYLLSTEFATLLSGRIIEKKLYPFALSEILRFLGVEYQDRQALSLNRNRIKNILNAYLQEGGMPELLAAKTNEMKRELLTSYFNTIIYKDIIPRFSVRHSGLLKEVALYLSGQTGSMINIKKLADIFQSNRNTITEFISFLQLSFLLLLLNKFDFSAKRRQLALRKSFVIDNGFATFLPLRFSPDRGELLENLVCIELMRRHGEIFYWKDHNECDFIIYNPQQSSQAIQVCYELDEMNRNRELAGLKSGCDYLNLKQGLILTYDQTDQFIHNGIQVNVIPVYEWLLNPSTKS